MNDIFRMAEQAFHALTIAESELRRLYKENAELKSALQRALEDSRSKDPAANNDIYHDRA